MVFCVNCGAQIAENAIFCTNCGAQQGQPQAQQPVYQQPVYPQPVYQQPMYSQAVYMVKPKIPGRGFGISSMVLGIIGLVYSFFMMIASRMIASMMIVSRMIASIGVADELSSSRYYGYRSSDAATPLIAMLVVYSSLVIMAACFSVAAHRRGYRNGVSKSGLVLGILSLVFVIIGIIVLAPHL